MKSVIWLTPDFPLKTEELLPLLDILDNKVKDVRILRDLFIMKLPPGTFPVKVDHTNPFKYLGLNVYMGIQIDEMFTWIDNRCM